MSAQIKALPGYSAQIKSLIMYLVLSHDRSVLILDGRILFDAYTEWCERRGLRSYTTHAAVYAALSKIGVRVVRGTIAFGEDQINLIANSVHYEHCKGMHVASVAPDHVVLECSDSVRAVILELQKKVERLERAVARIESAFIADVTQVTDARDVIRVDAVPVSYRVPRTPRMYAESSESEDEETGAAVLREFFRRHIAFSESHT